MKKKIAMQNILYPMPVTIIGAMVDGKVNFINIAHVGILNASSPHLISLAMSKTHYTNAGIKKNQAFSINILSSDQVVEADYVGMVSGMRTDKSNVFEVFFGDLANAPMIKNCPLSAECRLVDVYDVRTHDVMIGEIVSTYAEEEILTDKKVDIVKLDPLLFDMNSVKYWRIGTEVGKAWSEGKKYTPKR